MEGLKLIRTKVQLHNLDYYFKRLNMYAEMTSITNIRRGNNILSANNLTRFLRHLVTTRTQSRVKIHQLPWRVQKSTEMKHSLVKASKAADIGLLCSIMAAGVGAALSVSVKMPITLLQLAQCHDSTELESFLEGNKISGINGRHPLGWTALHVAAANGKTEILKMLIEMGADVNAGDEFSNIYSKAQEKGVDPVAVMMRRQYEFSTSTNTYMTFTGFTALHYAVLCNNFEIVELLLKAGANPMAVNSSGHQSAKYAQSQEIKDLLFTYASNFKKLEELKKIEQRHKFPLDERLKLHIIGQDIAVKSVTAAICRKENGWMNDERPLVLLFLGSSGTGKTELTKQLAHYLHQNKPDAFVRIDMSEYQEKHESSKLIGPPPGYVGYAEGGQLTEKLQTFPNAVVLFDEIDKAHPDVLNILLQLFDEGRLTDGKGKTIDCKDAVFVLTSNLAVDEIARKAMELRNEARVEQKTASNLDGIRLSGLGKEDIQLLRDFQVKYIQPILRRHFCRDEFIGRINEVVYFLPFTKSDLNKLVIKELEFWAQKAFKEHEIKLEWTKDVENFIAEGYNEHYGARSIKNETERTIINSIAEAHGNGTISRGSKVTILIQQLCDGDGDSVSQIAFQIETK